MHVVIDLDGTTIDVGLNPLLLGAEICSWNSVDLFANVQAQVLQEYRVGIATIFATI
jgi:hypothetical protein